MLVGNSRHPRDHEAGREAPYASCPRPSDGGNEECQKEPAPSRKASMKRDSSSLRRSGFLEWARGDSREKLSKHELLEFYGYDTCCKADCAWSGFHEMLCGPCLLESGVTGEDGPPDNLHELRYGCPGYVKRKRSCTPSPPQQQQQQQ